MDRFFIDKANFNFENNTCFIVGEDVKHIAKVLRYDCGDELQICDNEDNEFICEIETIDKSVVNLNIITKCQIKREPNVKIKVYQGIPKGQKLELILQKLTEIGVSEIIPVATKRSVSKIDDKNEDKKVERWQRIIYEGAKQSKRGIIPTLKGPMSFKDAINDMKTNDLNLVPYEKEESTSIKKAIRNRDDKTIGIFIGPEGGFEEDEIQTLQSYGAMPITLGPRILRTETAPIVAASIVLYELSDLGGDV